MTPGNSRSLDIRRLSRLEAVALRLFDMVGGVVGTIALLPVSVFVVIAIKLDSRGPALYRSERWGQHGSRIWIWKFRTMIDGADEILQRNDHLNHAYNTNIKLLDDPRITRVGRIIRRLSIDEIPQLINVILGQMSLVGPRPKLVGEEARYGSALPAVLTAKPGLTGLWQVSGRNCTSYKDRILLDLEYLRIRGPITDFRIVLKTIPVVLKGDGAY